METNQNLLTAELQVDGYAHIQLKETAMWAKFLGIVGFIFSGIIAIVAFLAKNIFSNMTQGYGTNPAAIDGVAGMMTIMYLIAAAISFFMSLYIFRFATQMKIALQNNDQDQFHSSLLNLKRVYRMIGIITIIYLGLFTILLLVGLGSAAFMRVGN